MFERLESREELREQNFSKGSGYLLYRIVDDQRRRRVPDAPQDGQQARPRSRTTSSRADRAEIVRDLSNAKQEIINFRKIVRPQRAVLRDLERTKQRYLADELEIYFDDISDARRADLGHARELQGGRRGARVDERVGRCRTA